VRVLLASKFLHHVGGVETYLRWLANALDAAGHEVALLGMSPPQGEPLMDFPAAAPIYLTPCRSYSEGAAHRVRSAAASVYSPTVGRICRAAIEEFQPDVVHFHCTCYQLTPAIFRETARASVPAFMTAHEYKLICANQILLDERRHQICTACLGRAALGKSASILRRGCINGSFPASLLAAVETPIAERLWGSCEGTVLAPSQFIADLLGRDGHVAGEIRHLELPWPPIRPPAARDDRDSVLFLGRLAHEKGISTALSAWRIASRDLPGVRFRLAGTGPDAQPAAAQVAREGLERVDFLGHLDAAAVAAELDRAIATVHPAVWYENSPFSVRESLCAGVPAIVSDLGGMAELVPPSAGWVEPAGDPARWAEAITRAVAERRAATAALTEAVAARWVGPDAHLEALLALYRVQR
jgi:glycosyltransferase involved in cell wall biosynthesis